MNNSRRDVFRRHAPDYWEAGLSAIPVEPGTKQPAAGLKGWTGYCNNGPSSETREEWLARYSNHGLGLCLGRAIDAQFRLTAIDVDDDRFVRLVASFLDGSVCAKKGRRGITYFTRTQRTAKLKSTKINDNAGKGVIDILCSGKFTVLPPSIHPDTQQPYQWCGNPLPGIPLAKLPLLNDRTFKMLRVVASSEFSETLISGEGTHDAGLRLTASMIAYGATDDEVERIISALLPENYQGNSISELPGWIRDAREKGFGENETARKTSAAQRLITLFDEAGWRLFQDGARAGYMTVLLDEGGQRHFRLRSQDARLRLTGLHFEAGGKPIPEKALDEALRALEARARFKSPVSEVFLRVASTQGKIFIDLGIEDGLVVRISAEGWDVGHFDDVKFVRSRSQKSLPIPTRHGDVEALREILGLSRENWQLVLAFLLNCLQPRGPYMLLLLEGEQGSGKSFLSKVIKQIIDPSEIEKARLPESQRDLMLHAKDFYLPNFDNVSGMKNDMSDALCVLSTGGGYATRQLYTDDELFIFNFMRPVILNGISDFAGRPDLMERSIPLRLPARVEESRMTERELEQKVREELPRFLGALYDVAACALRNLPTTTPISRIRMADCATFIQAGEEQIGLPAGTLVKVIVDAQDEVMVERIQNDPVFGELMRVLANGPFEGTVQELFDRVSSREFILDRYFPKSASHFSRWLERQKPALAKSETFVVNLGRRSEGKRLRVWRRGQEDMPPAPHPLAGAPKY